MTRQKLNNQEIASFQTALQQLRARLVGDVNQLTGEALRTDPQSGAITAPASVDAADLGSDVFDQEFTLGLIENEQETLHQIGEALERIEQGQFGLCPRCERPIAKARLRAIPYATYCIDCARAIEQGAPETLD